MLQLHRLVERLLRLRRAGDREVNRAEDRMGYGGSWVTTI
jgi:hypothetical protein